MIPSIQFRASLSTRSSVSLLRRLGATLGLSVTLLGCATQSREASWPPVAKKWFDRAEYSYRAGDMADAEMAAENALAALPSEPQVKLLAAQIAMAELNFEKALEFLGTLPGTEAAGLRGRCFWYLGRLEEAAQELALVTADPEVRDGWAKNTLLLARSGRGRRPFEISGGLLSAVQMPRAGNTTMFVPLEVNGEPSLAVIATDRVETVMDGKSPEWVSLRFGGNLEVSDVPVVAQDLSGLSKEMGAPVKLLIGVHLLRRIRATIDLAGQQFVVRSYEPPAPPQATTINPAYYKGGAMVLPGYFGTENDAPSSSLLMNTSMAFPLALDEEGWKKAGQDPERFVSVPGQANLKHGMVPMLRLGAFEIAQVPGVLGAPIAAIEKEAGADLDGAAGSGLFATFRLTFADGGRTLWMEDLPPDVIELRRQVIEEARMRQMGRMMAPPSSEAAPAPRAPAPAGESDSGTTPPGHKGQP